MADSPTPCTPVDSDQGTSYGAFLGGILFAFMFYGANCLQIFVYLVNYPNDRMTLKALVAGVWAADTVHQILGTIGIWQYLVSNFGNYVFLEQIYVYVFHDGQRVLKNCNSFLDLRSSHLFFRA